MTEVIGWSACLFLCLVDRHAHFNTWGQSWGGNLSHSTSYISIPPSPPLPHGKDTNNQSCAPPLIPVVASYTPPLLSPPFLCLPLSQWKCSAGPRAPASNCWWIECFHGVLGRALPWISMLTYTCAHTQHVLRYTNGLVCSLMGRGDWFEQTAAALWRKHGQAWWIFKRTHMYTHVCTCTHTKKKRENKSEDISKLHSCEHTHIRTISAPKWRPCAAENIWGESCVNREYWLTHLEGGGGGWGAREGWRVKWRGRQMNYEEVREA